MERLSHIARAFQEVHPFSSDQFRTAMLRASLRDAELVFGDDPATAALEIICGRTRLRESAAGRPQPDQEIAHLLVSPSAKTAPGRL